VEWQLFCFEPEIHAQTKQVGHEFFGNPMHVEIVIHISLN
jgi:hypothetical protein